MSLAKPSREPLRDVSEFDDLVTLQSAEYISEYISTTCKATRSLIESESEESDSVIIVSDNALERKPRFKLLQFRENHRPAYYGSWQRARGSITPRNPFRRNEVQD